MNCVSIGKVINDGLLEEVYVPPAPGDSGTAIGAALAAYRDATGILADGPAGVRVTRAYERIIGLDHMTAGISTDSARGSETTGNNRLVRTNGTSGRPAPLSSRPARLPGTR